MKRTVLAALACVLLGGCSTPEPVGAQSPSSPPLATSAGQDQAALIGPITDARAFADLLGRIAESAGDPLDLGEADRLGDLGVMQAWLDAGWPADGFGMASPTSIDVHPLRGADTVDVPFIAYAIRDTQDRCALGAITYSPAGEGPEGIPLVSVVVPGLAYRDCTSQVAAEEFGTIIGTMHGDQP